MHARARPRRILVRLWRHAMKKALFSVVLAGAITGGAAIAPVFADDISKDRVVTSGKIGTVDHKDKSSRWKKSKQSGAAATDNAIQDDYYTSAREQMIKSAM